MSRLVARLPTTFLILVSRLALLRRFSRSQWLARDSRFCLGCSARSWSLVPSRSLTHSPPLFPHLLLRLASSFSIPFWGFGSLGTSGSLSITGFTRSGRFCLDDRLTPVATIPFPVTGSLASSDSHLRLRPASTTRFFPLRRLTRSLRFSSWRYGSIDLDDSHRMG
jgi:hypothetical protein